MIDGTVSSAAGGGAMGAARGDGSCKKTWCCV